MINDKILGIVYSNMHDHMVSQVTENRTMGSVPFGCRYRLIDFALSNLVNSGVSTVGVITKSNYQSLMDHLGTGREWDLSRKKGGLCILPPFGHSNAGIYRGRIEAVGGIMSYVKHSNANYVILSDCDLIINIDYEKFYKAHIEKNADISIMYKKMPIDPRYIEDTTVLKIDEDGFLKESLISPTSVSEGAVYLNICIISKNLLERIVTESLSRGIYSFRRGILQEKCNQYRIYCYEVEGYCSKISSIEGYFKANMDILSKEVRDEIFCPERPIYTKVRDEVPAKYGINANVKNSLVADGAIIEGTVENSIIFRGVQIKKGAVVKNSIIMQQSIIMENASLNNIITDKNVIVRNNRTLTGTAEYPVVISKGSVV